MPLPTDFCDTLESDNIHTSNNSNIINCLRDNKKFCNIISNLEEKGKL